MNPPCVGVASLLPPLTGVARAGGGIEQEGEIASLDDGGEDDRGDSCVITMFVPLQQCALHIGRKTSTSFAEKI